MKYNWQLKDWPEFRYSLSKLNGLLLKCLAKINLFAGSLNSVSKNIHEETIIHFMVSEAIKSSEIEGEFLSREDVLSSIKNHFGLNQKFVQVTDQKAEGISQIMVDAYKTFHKPLSKKQLHEWHAMLFKSQINNQKLSIGKYRSHKEPMQVISGYIGKVKIHFEAPPSEQINQEMQNFIQWFNDTAPGKEKELTAPIRAAIAHLYFESIHPYEDGNGRLGRAIAEKALAQSLGYPILLNLSKEIEAHKKTYYSKLEESQKSNEITDWLEYFLNLIISSAGETSKHLNFIIEKSKFYDKFKEQLNLRQKKVIQRMLEEGNKGFEGGINARKYISICKCSKATATRDLTDLLEKQITKKRPGAGRNISYDLAIGLE